MRRQAAGTGEARTRSRTWGLQAFLILIAISVPWGTIAGTAEPGSRDSLDADHETLVSEADLIYTKPAVRPVEGQPIGNGRMGTMVWTTPCAVHFQINRNDVFAVNRNHAGEQHGPADYCGGCAAVAVELGGNPFAAGDAFRQRLSLYNAEVRMTAPGVSVRCFVASQADVLLMEINDQREEPQPVRVSVSMWRDPEVLHGDHSARHCFSEFDDTVTVVQSFDESDHHCKSAVAVRVEEDAARVEPVNERCRVLAAPAKRGRRVVLIGSAAWLGGISPDHGNDIEKSAAACLARVTEQSYEQSFEEHRKWWHEFWARTFVRVGGEDPTARMAQRVRYRHLYYMASSSRGLLPPKWNGSLFATAGDEREWGSQFWVWTTEMLYFPLAKADALDLMEPYFNMVIRQLPNCKEAARQRWGCGGAFFPETAAFDGPRVLPEDVAAEFRDVFLGRKKPAELSTRTDTICRFDGHLRASTRPREGRYTWISHVASSGSELAAQAWWRYRSAGDDHWLRTHAYPLLRETVEFYRHLVNKGDDGRYHLSGTNAHEDFWGVDNAIMDLAAIRGTVPLAVRAAEILKTDTELRGKWIQFLNELAPYAMGSDPRAQALNGGVLASDVWAAGHLGAVDGQHNPEDVWLAPVFPFEDWTLQTRNPATDRIVHKILDLAPRHASVLRGEGLGTAIRTPIAVARAGRGRELPIVLQRYYAAFAPLPNDMSLFEGTTAASIEHLGLLSTVLQDALVQSVSARPGEPESIILFPAWPEEWDASFRLLVRGGFVVSAAVENGRVLFVEVESRLGETCRIRNPWHKACKVTDRAGISRTVEGEFLVFGTGQGEIYRVTPR